MTGDSARIWQRLRQATPARIALGRAGAGLPTRHALALALAHARARDAVQAALDAPALAAALDASLGLPSLTLASAASSRADYLLRPDLGRMLAHSSREAVRAVASPPCDIAIVVADGLSALAVGRHAIPLLNTLLPRIRAEGWSIGPVALVSQGRVAIGDEIGALLKVRLCLVLIGERPGLSAPDSLGLYLTYAPRPGRSDAERNCISNIHDAGLSCDAAAFRAVWLMREMLRRALSGVALKDESDLAPIGGAGTVALGGGDR
jgi:ethanolamine ammonia-lyase small subunit